MPRNSRDIKSRVFIETNHTEDLSISGTESGDANIAAVLKTLINELETKGITDATITGP